MAHRLATSWPLFDLVVHTPRLELRYPDDEMVAAIAGLALTGIHDPSTMPFEIAWTDLPPDEQRHGAMQFHWRTRAELSPESWRIPLAIFDDGVLVGQQDVTAISFPARRVVETGSWLGRAHQGRGIGTEMRQAVLHLAFAGLGADLACTAAWHDNAASLGVTRKVGYEPNGIDVKLRRGVADRQERFVMTRSSWEQRRRDDITIEGLGPCLPLLGLAPCS